MAIIRPMLAQSVTGQQLYKISYPAIVQVKFDGVRGLAYGGRLVSRSGKNLPNMHIQKFFEDLQSDFSEAEGLDGELIIGNPSEPNICMKTTSGVMTYGGTPDFTFYAFDIIGQGYYLERRLRLMQLIDKLPEHFRQRIKLVADYEVNQASEIEHHMATFLGHGLEGCIIRHPAGYYKHGRSTFKQGWLLKYKDIQEDEAIVVGFEPLRRNMNEAHTDELGYTKRSSHKANKVEDDLLGALMVRSLNWDGIFNIGTGFDERTRREIWNNQNLYMHGIVKFKYLAAGMKDLPRHPVFLGFRDQADMDISKVAALTSLAGK